MSTFQNNFALSLMGEAWKKQIVLFAESIDTPEAQMLAARLAEGGAGEVEDMLTMAVLCGAISDLREPSRRWSNELEAE
jgi:hypothetical protein